MFENQSICRSYKNLRNVNQDAFAKQRLSLPLMREVLDVYVVADGVGSDFQSEFASSIVCNMFLAHMAAAIGDEIAQNPQVIVDKEWLTESDEEECRLIQMIRKCFKQTNLYLQRQCYETGMKRTTLSVCVIIGDWLFCANVGDSPVYLLKNSKLELISSIHNLAGKREEENPDYYKELDEQKKRQDSRRLLKCLGHFDRFDEPDISKHPWGEGMILVIGSDGGFGELSKEDIEYILSERKSLEERTETLISESALHTTDNQTVIVVCAKEREEI